jgi:hypothetical protein
MALFCFAFILGQVQYVSVVKVNEFYKYRRISIAVEMHYAKLASVTIMLRHWYILCTVVLVHSIAMFDM